MGRSGGAAGAEEPAEQLEQLVSGSPTSLVDAPVKHHKPRHIAGALALLAGVAAVIAVSLISVWNFVVSHVMRAAMEHWAGH